MPKLPKIFIPSPRPDEVNEGGTGLQEAAALDAGVDLKDKKKLNQLNVLHREDEEKRHDHRLLIWSKYAGFGATIVVGLVWLVQLVLPSDKKFLNPADEKQLYTVLVSGGLGTVFGRVTKGRSK